jgi:hypothetical protein
MQIAPLQLQLPTYSGSNLNWFDAAPVTAVNSKALTLGRRSRRRVQQPLGHIVSRALHLFLAI